MRKYSWGIALGLALLTHRASATVLYQPSGTQFPEAQNWVIYGALGTVASRSADSTHTSIDTGENDTRAGWSNTIPFINTLANASFPTLDRATGFTLTLGLKINSESHATNDRAGFSVILLGNDHQGIELGFWDDEIWAQSGPLFTHGEGTGTYDTTIARTYSLSILNSTYTLNDGTSDILSGSLRDYSSAALDVPYGLNNYLFFGDNTTSATGAYDLTGMAIAVPEPGALALMISLFSLAARRRRQ
jgi:hypothetical protein